MTTAAERYALWVDYDPSQHLAEQILGYEIPEPLREARAAYGIARRDFHAALERYDETWRSETSHLFSCEEGEERLRGSVAAKMIADRVRDELWAVEQEFPTVAPKPERRPLVIRSFERIHRLRIDSSAFWPMPAVEVSVELEREHVRDVWSWKATLFDDRPAALASGCWFYASRDEALNAAMRRVVRLARLRFSKILASTMRSVIAREYAPLP